MRGLALLAFVPCAFSQPVIQSIENAASSVAGPIAPQMLVTIRGVNLASQALNESGSPLPMSLGGTSVSFNGVSAPLLYVSPSQINAQVPTAAGSSADISVVVTAGAASSAPFSVAAALMQPGIFTQDSSGCGQASAYNIHSDGSLTINTPETSLDPTSDLGLAIFLTGLGPFPDREDGVPWQYNPADNQAGLYLPRLGNIALQSSTFELQTAYAGPAPGAVGVDQINAMFYEGTAPSAPEGCEVPMSISLEGTADTQYVNVSIHTGGGKCVNPAPASMGILTWSQTVTSDASGVTSEASFQAQFLEAPGLGYPSPNAPSFGDGPVQAAPSFCAASYPATLSAGTLKLPAQVGATVLSPQNSNGILSYSAGLAAANPGGNYTVTGSGASGGVGAFSAAGAVPAAITITTNLSPGTAIQIPFTVNWTGGDRTSQVTVTLVINIPGQTANTLYDTEFGDAGSATLMPLPCIFCFAHAQLDSSPASYELIVSQISSASPSDTFSAPGLTLGGEQTWNYVWDFKGLTEAAQ